MPVEEDGSLWWRKGSPWVLLLLLAWYASSSVAVLLTKWIYSGAGGIIEVFPFGLTVTATNNIFAWLISVIISGTSGEIFRDSNVLRLSAIIGATTAAEIGLSNIALSMLSVSYSTVLKGMAPLFVMAWGAAFGLIRLRTGLVLSMVAIVVGVVLAFIGQSGFTHVRVARGGFLSQLTSCILAGCRWVLTQVFVNGESIRNASLASKLKIKPLSRSLTVVDIIRCTTPLTLAALVPAVVLVEGLPLAKWIQSSGVVDCGRLLASLLLIGCCVFVLLWAEYELVKATSSLTVSICLVFKEIMLIYAGRVLFGDSLSWTTWIGFVVVQAGVIGYAVERRTARRSIPEKDVEQP